MSRGKDSTIVGTARNSRENGDGNLLSEGPSVEGTQLFCNIYTQGHLKGEKTSESVRIEKQPSCIAIRIGDSAPPLRPQELHFDLSRYTLELGVCFATPRVADV